MLKKITICIQINELLSGKSCHNVIEIYKYKSERFEPRWVNAVVWVIVRVCSVVLRRTVVGVDWRFDNLSGSHSDDGLRSGCRNVSQHQQQSFSGPHYKPGWSLKAQQIYKYWNFRRLVFLEIFELYMYYSNFKSLLPMARFFGLCTLLPWVWNLNLCKWGIMQTRIALLIIETQQMSNHCYPVVHTCTNQCI